MKIALYIEDGLEQIVLTPDSETEAGILKKIAAADRELSIHSGAFYGCRGGWTRWKQGSGYSVYGSLNEDESTIIVLRPKPKVDVPPAHGQRAEDGK